MLEKLLTGWLPKGQGTYVALGIALLVIWGSYAASAFGFVGEPVLDQLGQQACVAGAETIDDADAKAAVIQACTDFTAKPVSLLNSVLATAAVFVAAFLRRSISGLLSKIETLKGGTGTQPPPGG
jgi:hypothetical protein